jgi:hypothetical protein
MLKGVFSSAMLRQFTGEKIEDAWKVELKLKIKKRLKNIFQIISSVFFYLI